MADRARPGSTEGLLRSTSRRLYVVTLALIALLLACVGTATALVGLRALDAEVDRALAAAVTAQLEALGGELPVPAVPETDDEVPAASDTFLLVLDLQGHVVANRTRAALPGLPDGGAVEASVPGQDFRTVESAGLSVRLLTVPVRSEGGAIIGYVQGGFVLTLHDRESRSLVLAIAVVGVAGLAGAAFLTLLLTRRALVPIRHALESQRRFVADASHELRTPAALIRANAEVLEREGLVTADGAPLIADMIAEADRLGGLVGDLLQLTTWDETRLTLTLGAVDIGATAADTVRGAQALAAERGCRLEVVQPPAPAIVRADRARVIQLLLILLDNAIDHSPRGGLVTVRVALRDGARVAVDVDDQGPGIPAAERERIFAPFTRLSGTTRHGSAGTGLGLAIARRIVDAHDGTIEAGSPATGGARLTFVLRASMRGSALEAPTAEVPPV